MPSTRSTASAPSGSCVALQAAHRDLLAVVPGSEFVTDVAIRYGFSHLGRFAAEYRKAFGESPSETLRR